MQSFRKTNSIYKSNPQKRLICFHHAGGNSSLFSKWNLGENVKVTRFQLPGRLNRLSEEPVVNWPQLRQIIFNELNPTYWGDSPIAIFGHSLGGLIAFHFARELENIGQQVESLCISAVSPQPKSPISTPFSQMSDQELLDRLKQLNGTPKIIWEHKDLLQLILPSLRADYSLLENLALNTGSDSISCPVHIFAGKSDNAVDIDSLSKWQNWSTSKIKMHLFPGEHFYLNERSTEVVDRIKSLLGT